MRIACIAPYVAYEGIDHAGGLYLERYLSELIELGHEVRLFAPRTPDNVAALEQRLAAPTTLGASPPTSRWRRATQLVLSGSGANSVRATDFLGGLEPSDRTWLLNAEVLDLQWYDCIVYAPSLRRQLGSRLVVGTSHDLLSQSVKRAARGGPSLSSRLKSRIKLPLVRFWESRALEALDHISVFKRSDVDFVRSLGVTTPADTTIPVVETFDHLAVPNLQNEPTVVFVAAFARPENDEAARWLAREIVPKVHATRPDVRFRFAGSRPPEWLRDMQSTQIEVTGYLESMASAYENVDCVVVPLRRGAGLKFKTIQAMALGLPVVSTGIGSEGVEDLCGFSPYAVAESTDEVADALLRALQCSDECRQVLDDQGSRIREALDFTRQMELQSERFTSLLR